MVHMLLSFLGQRVRLTKNGVVVKVPKKINWNPTKTEEEAKKAEEGEKTSSTTERATIIRKKKKKSRRKKLRPRFSTTTTTTTETPEEEIVTTASFFVTPSTTSSTYDPCSVADACGPNAICKPKGSEPDCSCPDGFGGIPR